MIPELVLGETSMALLDVIDRNNETVDISDADTVKVALISTDHENLLAGPYEADEEDDDADWVNGVVAVELPAADTEDLTVTELYFQVRVFGGDHAGSYFSPIKVKAIKGLIEDEP